MAVRTVALGGTDWVDNSDSLDAADWNDTMDQEVNDLDTTIAQSPPVGSIVGFHKDWSETTDTIPDGWLYCDGSVISDSESPINGQTLPDLNGTDDDTKRFLRGSDTAGTTGGSSTHNHSVPKTSCRRQYNSTYPNNLNANTSIPPYFEVAFMMRIK